MHSYAPRAFAALLISAAILPAQYGTQVRPAASEYPAHADLKRISLGAEFMVHSFTGHDQMFTTNGYLTVEVAVFPSHGAPYMIENGAFTLRLNGKGTPLLAQPPGMVAAAMKYPDWENKPVLEGTAGLGDAQVVVGRPPAVGRFPGDPGANRPPRRPEVPAPDHAGLAAPPVAAEQVVVESALPEGGATGPVSGFLYFPWRGKMKSVHSVELLYREPDGEVVTLKLR